jgi:hypothetical protein
VGHELQIGDRVVARGETFVVVGFSPMSIVPQVVYLADPETGGQLDAVLLEEVEKVKRD